MDCSTAMERMRIIHGNQFIMEIRRRFEEIRRSYDLKKVELQIINYLYFSEDQQNTAKDVSMMLCMNKTMVSKTLDGLCKKGLVESKPDVNDRRFIHYSLTDRAQPVIKDIQKAWKYMRESLFVGISDEESEEFFKICKILHNNLIHMQDEEQSSAKP